MSQRKSPVDQMAEEIGCLIIGLLWVAAVGLFTLIFKASRAAPEDQLLKLQPGYAWLWPIEPSDCPQCGTANESQLSTCYRCGTVLPRPAGSESEPATDGYNTTTVIIVWVLCLVAIFIVVALTNSGGMR